LILIHFHSNSCNVQKLMERMNRLSDYKNVYEYSLRWKEFWTNERISQLASMWWLFSILLFISFPGPLANKHELKIVMTTLKVIITVIILVVQCTPSSAFVSRGRPQKLPHITSLSAKNLNRPGQIDLPVIPVIGPIINAKPLVVRSISLVIADHIPLDWFIHLFVLSFLSIFWMKLPDWRRNEPRSAHPSSMESSPRMRGCSSQ
jgi:hypothetical protein